MQKRPIEESKANININSKPDEAIKIPPKPDASKETEKNGQVQLVLNPEKENTRPTKINSKLCIRIKDNGPGISPF